MSTKPSFFALFSKAGIACAADSDHTIYRLSKDLPVALAVNPKSIIPWDQIIEEYKSQLNPKPHTLFEDYAFDFDLFLSTFKLDEQWTELTDADSNIMFLGYGDEDIFPVVYDVYAVIRADGTLGLGCSWSHYVTMDDPAFFHFLGDFDSVSTLLHGATAKTTDFFYTQHVELFEKFVGRITEKFKGTKYEQYVADHLASYDYRNDVEDRIKQATKKSLLGLTTGVGSFSVEDMVTAVESIVNANVKLNHLRTGASGKPGESREIAVITIPEGLSWIKHSLYLRRNEI